MPSSEPSPATASTRRPCRSILRPPERPEETVMATRGSVPPSDQARLHHMSQLEPSGGSEGTWGRWVTFAATVLVLLGCLNGLQGFLAMLDDGYYVAQGRELALVSYDAWGAILVLWGAV